MNIGDYMSVIEIINQRNEISIKVEEHKLDYVNAEEKLQETVTNINNDFVELLKLYNIENEDIDKMRSMIENIGDMCLIINYLINGNPKTVEDIYRQIYVINGKPIPYEYHYEEAEPIDFSDEEQEVLDTICLPYDISDFNTTNHNQDAFLQDVYYIQKLINKEKDKKRKKILASILDTLAQPVPEEDVKEIHAYFPNGEMERIFLDTAGVHEIVGKRSRLKFKNGKKLIGYVGTDFFDNDNNPCISIFEAFDERKGFYKYNLYKLDDLYGVDTLYTHDIINYDVILPDEILDNCLIRLLVFRDLKEEEIKTVLSNLKDNKSKMSLLDNIMDNKIKGRDKVLEYCKKMGLI
jgi:hypothetical protein